MVVYIWSSVMAVRMCLILSQEPSSWSQGSGGRCYKSRPGKSLMDWAEARIVDLGIVRGGGRGNEMLVVDDPMYLPTKFYLRKSGWTTRSVLFCFCI